MKKLAILSLALLLSGFAASAHADSLSVSIGAPPPVREEVVTPAPGPDNAWVWHKGHWRWIDESYVWVPGHWVKRPHPNAVWVEPHWDQRPGGWIFVKGYWR